MADPNINDDLREQGDLAARLTSELRKQRADADAFADSLDVINSIEEDIVSNISKGNIKKHELSNIQKDISDKVVQYNELLENVYTTDTQLADKLKEIKKLKTDELKLQKDISREEKFNELKEQIPILGNIYKRSKDIMELWKANPIFAVISVLTELFNSFVKVFTDLDSAAADFRITMGFIRSDTSTLEKNIRNSYFNLAQTGVTAKELYESFKAVNQTIGTSRAATIKMAEDMALLNTQLGVAQSTSAEFSRTMGMMGNSTMDAQKNISLFTSRLSAAAGTNLNDVMSDVANSSKTSYQFITRNPLALAKAAVEAKKLGTSLSDATKSASQLIDFTSSVKSEMEASVLLGESINLQRARELSYRRDLKGLNEEILNIAQKARFEELDPFQQDAIAKALGKSADEVGKMLQAQREMRRIRADGSLAKEVAEYDKLVSSTDEMAKSTAESARNNLMNLSNQTSLKAISLALKSIYQHMFQPLVDLAAKVLPWIAKSLQSIHEITGKWSGAILGVVGLLGIIIGTRGLGKIISWATGGISKSISNMFGGISEGVSKFGSSDVIKGAFGLLLVAASLIPLAYSLKLMDGVSWKTFGIMAASLTLLVLAVASLGAIMMSGIGTAAILAGAAALLIIGSAMIPFAYAATLMSNSIKSLEGVDLIGIASGLMAIGASSLMLVTLVPFLPLLAVGFGSFGLSLRFIASPMERVGKASFDLGIGLEKTASALEKIADLSLTRVMSQFKDLASTISSISREVNDIPDIKIGKLQDIIIKSSSIGIQQTQKSNDEMIKAIEQVKLAIDALRSSLEKGGVSSNVYIDSQRLDSGMSRRLSFTGPLSPQPIYN